MAMRSATLPEIAGRSPAARLPAPRCGAAGWRGFRGAARRRRARGGGDGGGLRHDLFASPLDCDGQKLPGPRASRRRLRSRHHGDGDGLYARSTWRCMRPRPKASTGCCRCRPPPPEQRRRKIVASPGGDAHLPATATMPARHPVPAPGVGRCCRGRRPAHPVLRARAGVALNAARAHRPVCEQGFKPWAAEALQRDAGGVGGQQRPLRTRAAAGSAPATNPGLAHARCARWLGRRWCWPAPATRKARSLQDDLARWPVRSTACREPLPRLLAHPWWDNVDTASQAEWLALDAPRPILDGRFRIAPACSPGTASTPRRAAGGLPATDLAGTAPIWAPA